MQSSLKSREKGGSQPYAELASRSVIAPDERIPLVRRVLINRSYDTTPSIHAYYELLREMCENNHWLLNEMLMPLIDEGMIPKARSYFDRGVVAGLEARVASSATLSLLSLAPLALRLSEGRALLTAVDTIELHLTPLLQAAAVELSRRAKRGWEESEEYPASLLLITHSSIVLSALLTEVEEGVKDRLVRLGEEYRLRREDVKTLVLHRREGVVTCEASQGIAQPSYLKGYARLL